MNKNAKLVIVALLFIALCLCLSMCSDDIGSGITSIISGEDGKCDYCGADAVIGQGTEEYCAPCFQKYDGNIWN